MRAAVVGAVGSTAILLDELSRADGWEVPIVVTLPEDLFGWHSDIVDLEPHAKRLGASLFRTGKTNHPDTLAAIDEADPDYIFVVGWSRLCGPEFLSLRKGAVIGYHPAALPRLRGRATIPWTILLDEKITAGSLFWMEEGTDDGDLLAQEFFHLAGTETAGELYDRHMDCLAEMLREVLPMLANGNERRQRQDERFATWSTKRTPDDGLIDWSASAESVDRLIRAVGKPYPGAFSFAGTSKITVWHCEIITQPNRYHAEIGQIVAFDHEALIIQTGQGLIKLSEWEIEGGQRPRLHTILGVRSDFD